MRALVVCEESQRVAIALRREGVEAFSCDLLPPSGGRPEIHIQADAIETIHSRPWDLLIGFPPCTDLAVSGARYFAAKRADGRQQAAIAFFMAIAEAPVPRIAIENPVGIMSTVWRRPDQIINPWEFGHPESKRTCIWVKGLPLLVPTDVLPLPPSGRWSNQTPSGQNKLGPSEDRARLRGLTYQGIADAMGSQWGRYVLREEVDR